MNTVQNPGWITRILVALITLTLVVVGFFFLTVALIAGALVAAVFGARLWWMMRKLKRAQADADNANVVDGDYRVIERESSTAQLPPKP